MRVADLLSLDRYLKMRAIQNRPATHYKYVTAHVAKIILVNYKLRWSSPVLFNDPFDVQRDFNFGFELDELAEPVVNEILRLISADSIPDLSRNPSAAFLIHMLRRRDNTLLWDTIIPELPKLIKEGLELARENSYKQIKEQWSEFIPDFRILCFSEVYDHPLMWSHYADSHKGVVLGFQSVDSSSIWNVSQPVTYQDSPPMWASRDEWVSILTGQANLDLTSVFTKYACTKTPEWAYEKEWRIISFCRKGETGHYSDYGFNPRELKSVYLGCDIPKEEADEIALLLQYDLAHVKLYRASKIERERRLSFEQVA